MSAEEAGNVSATPLRAPGAATPPPPKPPAAAPSSLCAMHADAPARAPFFLQAPPADIALSKTVRTSLRPYDGIILRKGVQCGGGSGACAQGGGGSKAAAQAAVAGTLMPHYAATQAEARQQVHLLAHSSMFSPDV
jgi:hypothetical protein